jgi:hypothetical protein
MDNGYWEYEDHLKEDEEAAHGKSPPPSSEVSKYFKDKAEQDLRRSRQREFLKAAKQGNIAEALALLKAGAHLNGGDHYSKMNFTETALMKAVRKGHSDMVSVLLAYPDIEVNRQTSTWGDRTALILAAVGNNLSVLQLLLNDCRININFVTTQGYTALMRAAWVGNGATITALLATPGINVNLANQQGDTAISVAFENGHIDIVMLLLEHGAILPEHLRAEDQAVNNLNGTILKKEQAEREREVAMLSAALPARESVIFSCISHNTRSKVKRHHVAESAVQPTVVSGKPLPKTRQAF